MSLKLLGDKTDICEFCNKETRVHCLNFDIDCYIWICEDCLYEKLRGKNGLGKRA
jgi:hypothetical protein